MEKHKICTIIGKNTEYTGRYYSDEYIPNCKELKMKLREKIEELYQSGIKNFMTDCEQGFSMWAAEEVINLKNKYWDIQLHAVLPSKKQTVNWREDVRLRCERIHKLSDSVTVLQNSYASDRLMRTLYVAYVMINCSSVLLIEDKEHLAFSYAEENGVEVICINPPTI